VIRWNLASESGRIAQMPPVVAWQSVLDSTVGAKGTVGVLFGALRGAQHRLVLLKSTAARPLRPCSGRPRASSSSAARASAAHTRWRSSPNNDRTDDSVVVHRLAPDGTLQEQPTALR